MTVEEFEEVWYLAWNGPYKVKFMAFYPTYKKTIIDNEGTLQVVESKDVFKIEHEAHTAAWISCLEKAGLAMDQAKKHKANADKTKQ